MAAVNRCCWAQLHPESARQSAGWGEGGATFGFDTPGASLLTGWVSAFGAGGESALSCAQPTAPSAA